MTFQQITHPDDLGADLAQAERVLNGEIESYTMEKRYLRKDGSAVWVSIVVRGVYDSAAKFTHFITIVEDITERRVAEEAEARLAAIVQSSDDVIISKDLNGIVTSWNPAATRIFGYSAEEAIGKSITLIIPTELHQEETEILNRLRAGQRIDHFETVRVNSSGKRLDVSLTISPIKDSKGRIIGASKIARDISERKQIENALRDYQSQLALALDSSRTATFDWDIRKKRGSWNAHLAGLYDFTPQGEYITDGEWQALFHPEDVGRIAEEAQRLLADSSRDQFHFEFRTRPQSGKSRWILSHGRVLRDAEGQALRLIGTHTDITERKLTEQALQQSDSRLRAAFGQTYSFLILLELDGTIIEANRAALDAAGQGREQVIGRKFWEPWWSSLPEEVAILKQSIAQAASGQAVRAECPFFSAPEGSVRFADRTLNPVFDANGKVSMIVGTALDITENKRLRDQLEERVRQRTHELEEKNKALVGHAKRVRELSGKLLQTQDEERRRLARELHDSAGQVLAALQMNLIPLQEDAEKLNPEFASGIGQCIGLVEDLTKELRTVSYLLHPPLLDEAGLSSALRWYLEGFAERSKIDVQLEISPELGRLPRDMEMTIFRIVQECLTNIHRHSGSDRAAIRVLRTRDEIEVEISDHGKGMPTSADGHFTPHKSGVGIQGMRERVRQLKGHFEIHSGPGGTTVRARMPVTAPALTAA
jgi:PAS domain S-box-containing protein